MNIVENIKIIEVKADEILNKLMPLYADAGWTNYTGKPEMLMNACKNSLCIMGAFDGETLIGIIRAVGDGFSILYIQDIIVLNVYQRLGIGSRLLKTMLKKYKAVYQTVFLTDSTEKTAGFYKSCGFCEACEFGCTAFFKQNP